MSPVGRDTVRSIAARLPADVAMVDAPVRGSVPQATEGHLEIFVGANDQDFERVRPILEPLGSVMHVGGPGTGAAMKLVATSCWARRLPRSARRWRWGPRSAWTGRPCSTCPRVRNSPRGTSQPAQHGIG